MTLPLSVCIIVKNEERNVKNLLESINEIASEIIIVDTGSTDNTKEICHGAGERFTALTIKLIDFEWNDDFSAARNKSIENASQDWIFVIDADAVFAEESKKDLVSCLNNHEITHYAIQFIDQKKDTINPLICLFRNRDDIKYTGRIHESPTFDPKNHKYSFTDIKVFHKGFADEKLLKEKLLRNEKLLKKSLEDELPNQERIRIEAYLIIHKINNYSETNEITELTNEIINFNNKIQNINEIKYIQIIEFFHFESYKYFIRNNRMDLALHIIVEGLKINPFSLNLLHEYALINIKSNDDFFKSFFILNFVNYLISNKIPECNFYSTSKTFLSYDYANYSLGSLCYEFGFYEASAFYFNNLTERHYKNLVLPMINVITGKASIINSLKKDVTNKNDPFLFFRLGREMIKLGLNIKEIVLTLEKAFELSKISDNNNLTKLIAGELIIMSSFISEQFLPNLDEFSKNDKSFYYYYCEGIKHHILKDETDCKNNFIKAMEDLCNFNFSEIINEPLKVEPFLVNRYSDENQMSPLYPKINILFKESLKTSYFYKVIEHYLLNM